MNQHKVIITLVGSGGKQTIAAPLEFDADNKPFAVYETWHRKGESEVIGRHRIPLDPRFLVKLENPKLAADFIYEAEVVAPKLEKI